MADKPSNTLIADALPMTNSMDITGQGASAQTMSWEPPRCDPERVLECIRTRDVAACRGIQAGELVVGSNVVERLAICYGLLREHDPSQGQPLTMWSQLEQLCTEVSPTFSELGADALTVFRTSAGLAAGKACDAADLDITFKALGRLWNAAFDGPSGFDSFIARSAAGYLAPDVSFFVAFPRDKLDARTMGIYLARMVDLLQTAVASRGSVSAFESHPLNGGKWLNRVGYLPSGRGSHRPAPLAIHAKTEPIGPNSDRVSIKLIDTPTDSVIAKASAVTLNGSSGMFDELLDASREVGGFVENVMHWVFAPSDVVSIYPRVRLLLDEAENQVRRVAVIEELEVVPSWRTRQMGRRLMRQLLLETGEIEIALGRPMAQFNHATESLPFKTQAALAATRIRLASYWARSGGVYAFNGVMALPLDQIIRKRDEAARERQAFGRP